MPSPVAHALAGCCVIAAAAKGDGAALRPAYVAAALAAANLPDTDFLLGPLLRPLGVALGHQGPTHSLAFVAAGALLLALAARGRLPLPRAWGWLLAAGASHLLLDLLSHNGPGQVRLPLFWPLSGALLQSPVLLFPGAERDDPVSIHNLIELFVELAALLPVLGLLLRRHFSAPPPEEACCVPCEDTGQRDPR